MMRKKIKKSGGGYINSYECSLINILSDVCYEIEDYKKNISRIETEEQYTNKYYLYFKKY